MNFKQDIVQKNSILNLSADDIKPFLSPYLTEGFREDDIVIRSACYETGRIQGQFSVEHAFIAGDGRFHLSMTAAANCIAQLGIIYACLDNDLKEKTIEIYATDLSIAFKRPVREKSFSVAINNVDLDARKRIKKYHIQGVIADGNFEFNVKFVFPLRSEITSGD